VDIDTDVLVIGAGISGLTAAFRLARMGMRVQVVEREVRVGGVIGTECADGVLYERGPNSILETNPHIAELVSDLGLSSERLEVSALASRRYVVRKGTLLPLPTSPPALLKTPLFSFSSKLRVLREPFVAPAPAEREESVSQFVERRLGRELLDYAIEPFVAGVYAGNPDELSVKAAFPRLYALEQRYGSLIKGQVLGARERVRHGDKARNTARSFTFRHGMQALPEALARAIGNVRTGAQATRIRPAGDRRLAATVAHADGPYEVHAGAVVLAVPARAAAFLLRDIAADAADALDEMPYAPVASVALAYTRSDVAHPLDGFGFLAPRVEGRRVLGSLFSSSMFEARAPEGKVLLTTFVGGQRNPEIIGMSDEEIVHRVRDELAELAGVRGKPCVCRVTRWREAIPQYTLGHLARVDRARTAEARLPGLYLCGSYIGGVAVGDCIKSAIETAERIVRQRAS
jgi:oxygen-dependent protoporphyrinogen oxidase